MVNLGMCVRWLDVGSLCTDDDDFLQSMRKDVGDYGETCFVGCGGMLYGGGVSVLLWGGKPRTNTDGRGQGERSEI